MPSRETWETIVKGGSAIAAVGTLMVSAAVFLDQRDDALEDFRRETKRPFLDQQFALYTEAVAVVSRLNAARQRGSLNRARQDLGRFYELYWGPLAMVEDSYVEAAMVLTERSLTANAEDPGSACARALPTASLHLAHAARRSLEQNWGVPLDTDLQQPKRMEDELATLSAACPRPDRSK